MTYSRYETCGRVEAASLRPTCQQWQEGRRRVEVETVWAHVPAPWGGGTRPEPGEQEHEPYGSYMIHEAGTGVGKGLVKAT